MTLALVVLLIAAVAGIIVLGTRGQAHPFLTLLICALAFGLAAGLSFGYTIRSMGDGFSTAVISIGLVLIAGSIAGTVLDRSAYGERLAGMLAGRARGKRLTGFLAICGFVGGLGAVAEFAFVLLMPLARVLARQQGQPLAGNALALALACITTNTVLVPAPGPIAAATILSADLWRTALWGSIVAVVAGLAGWAFSLAAAGRLRPDVATDAPPEPALATGGVARTRRCDKIAAALPVLLPMLLLLVGSTGHMPSEPFGGGPVRELLLTLGQPMTLLLASVAVAAALASDWRHPSMALSENGWPGQALADVASLVLIVGAAGAFARVVQNVGVGEMLAEQLVRMPMGILLPFAIAMAVKIAHGSSMLAIITAAAFMQPLLGQVGLDDDTGRALCAVAIGAGAMVASHANDTLFWTFTRLCRLTPAQGFRLLTLGTVVQGLAAAATLSVLAAVLR